MNKLAVLFSIIMLVSSSALKAQEDDMYFTSKKVKKSAKTEKATRNVEVVLETEEPSYVPASRVVASGPVTEARDVDEYNRRGKRPSQQADTVYADVQVNEIGDTYSLSAQSLYDLGYSEGYEEGFSDGNDIDFYYGLRLARFHGRHFNDPWYWNRISYVYDTWHWDPWYWDSWYRPYYYGGWYSVGWGIGYYGSYWNPYWPGYHAGYCHRYYPHHHWGGYHVHGPRVSTSRNHDYARTRIVDRRGSVERPGRSNATTGRHTAANRTPRRTSDRTAHLNERSIDRYNRVTDRTSNRPANRATDRSSNRASERTINRNTSERTVNRSASDRSRHSENSTVNRSSSRSTNRSITSSRTGSGSTSRGGSFGSPSGASRSGGGRGR